MPVGAFLLETRVEGVEPVRRVHRQVKQMAETVGDRRRKKKITDSIFLGSFFLLQKKKKEKIE